MRHINKLLALLLILVFPLSLVYPESGDSGQVIVGNLSEEGIIELSPFDINILNDELRKLRRTGTTITTDALQVDGSYVTDPDFIDTGDINFTDSGSGIIGTINNNAVGSDELASSGVAASSYTVTSLTVDVDGRITSASSGTIGPDELEATAVAAGSYSITHLTIDADGRITAASSSTIGADDLDSTSVSAGDYTRANITVDADGRLQSASNSTITINRCPMWYVGGAQVTGTDISADIRVPFAGTITRADAYLDVAASGSTFIIDINLNGSTIWSTQGDRLTLQQQATSADTATFDTTSVSIGDEFTLDIDQVGSVVEGTDLTVLLTVQETL